MHGPTCIFGAKLTPFPVQPEGPYTIKAFNVSMGSGWPANGDFTLFQVGLGRTVALHHRSSTLYQIHEYIRCLYF